MTNPIPVPLGPGLEAAEAGLFLPAFGVHVDPPAAVARAVLSHAHADHAVAGHAEVWATPETLAVYRRRNPDWRGTARTLPYGRVVAADGADGSPGAAGTRLSLLPSGHVLGAAQVFVETPDGSTLYTGDFRLGPSRTAAPAASPRADVLVMESTFGLPVFRFPPRSETEPELVAACRRAHDDGAIPIVLAYAFGKSQEAALALTEAGIPTVLHGASWKLLPDFEAAGFAFPLSRPYDSGPARPGEALLVPPYCARTPVARNVRKRRVLYLSGWATREASRNDFDADVLLPISDHADFDELLAHVASVRPSVVWTQHGYARDLARILSARGTDARPLSEGAERTSEDPASEEAEPPAARDSR